jgi:3',5'-cyclic AMP phosphodiesterase CpdA
MTLLFHLSDLHLARDAPSQGAVLERLLAAMRQELEWARPERVAVAITGDVFDSVSDGSLLVDTFLGLHDRILSTVGHDTPAIVIPGNHDRRRLGILGPHREDLFRALARAALGRRIFVAGTRTPFLAQVVPPAFHDLPAHVVTYDSSYLPRGLLGAGGTIRLEDLLQVHAQLPADDLPLLVLVHHHLIPTPITDVSGVDHARAPRLARWLVEVAAPALVSNADHEELTMTALGAGTALSALHSFSRPVLLLHGHKHVPTARLLKGMTSGCGDVLVVSAGTAGRRERIHAARHPDAARLWPSFNVAKLEERELKIDAVSFFPKASGARPSLRRQLARARAVGTKWELEAQTFRVTDPAPRVKRDDASFSLSVARRHRWDLACERTIELVEGARLRRYVDFVHSLPPLVPVGKLARGRRRRIELSTNGTTRYALRDALCRTVEEAARCYAPGTAFEWVGLLCRYGAATATVRLSRAGVPALEPFASATDLTTGREYPVRLEVGSAQWVATAHGCAPRSLLRIYWPLELAASGS